MGETDIAEDVCDGDEGTPARRPREGRIERIDLLRASIVHDPLPNVPYSKHSVEGEEFVDVVFGHG